MGRDLRVTLTPNGINLVEVTSQQGGGKKVHRDTRQIIPYESMGMVYHPGNGPHSLPWQGDVIFRPHKQLEENVRIHKQVPDQEIEG